eukprot:12892424-Prorocentrum_lima.AAC.1
MITRAKKQDPDFPEGSYYVVHGHTLEVLDIFSTATNYKVRTTPTGAIIIPNGKKGHPKFPINKTNMSLLV